MDLRTWDILAIRQFGCFKAELIAKIAENAHAFIVFAIAEEMCYSYQQKETPLSLTMSLNVMLNRIRHLIQRIR